MKPDIIFHRGYRQYFYRTESFPAKSVSELLILHATDLEWAVTNYIGK